MSARADLRVVSPSPFRSGSGYFRAEARRRERAVTLPGHPTTRDTNSPAAEAERSVPAPDLLLRSRASPRGYNGTVVPSWGAARPNPTTSKPRRFPWPSAHASHAHADGLRRFSGVCLRQYDRPRLTRRSHVRQDDFGTSARNHDRLRPPSSPVFPNLVRQREHEPEDRSDRDDDDQRGERDRPCDHVLNRPDLMLKPHAAHPGIVSRRGLPAHARSHRDQQRRRFGLPPT